MEVVIYLVRTSEWRELLAVLEGLHTTSATPGATIREGLARADAYFERYPARFRWLRGERAGEVGHAALCHSASSFAHMLAYTGVPAIADGEPLRTGVGNSTLHVYTRALTGNPNLSPVHGHSTQIIQGLYSWLWPEQLDELAQLQRALEVPGADAWRRERRRLQLASRTDEELDAEMFTLAGPWIRIVLQLDRARAQGLTYVAYAEPYDTE